MKWAKAKNRQRKTTLIKMTAMLTQQMSQKLKLILEIVESSCGTHKNNEMSLSVMGQHVMESALSLL